MTILVNQCNKDPSDSFCYKISTTEEGSIKIKPTNEVGGSCWTPKGLKYTILIEEDTSKDVVHILLGAKKITVDYSEIQDLMMAIKVYNKSKVWKYTLFELKEYL